MGNWGSVGDQGHNLFFYGRVPRLRVIVIILQYVLLLSFSKRCSSRTHTRSRTRRKTPTSEYNRIIIIIIRLCSDSVRRRGLYSIVFSEWVRKIDIFSGYWFLRTVSRIEDLRSLRISGRRIRNALTTVAVRAMSYRRPSAFDDYTSLSNSD